MFNTILICGGSGSLGHALTRFLLDHTSATIRILSRGELLQKQMAATFHHDPRLRFLIGDVRDLERLYVACNGVDLLVHAAALKHIDTGENDPEEFLKTNVTGTANVISACRTMGVQRAVFISSDKCVSPENVYGATKMVAERLWCQANAYTPDGTHYTAVRYGNVAASRGSVIPLWQSQLADGKPVTVTDTRMTRFWLDLDEAVRLVWFAACYGPRGHVIVPHIPAFSVLDLLDAVCHEQMYRSMTMIGMRPGEKLHEALATDEEMRRALAYYHTGADMPQYYAIPPLTHSWAMPQEDAWLVEDGSRWDAHGWNGYTSDVWKTRLSVEDLHERLSNL